MKDLIYTQRFTPEIGGSISWLKDIFSSWPEEVKILTHQYEGLIANSDEVRAITRADLKMRSWGILNPASFLKYLRAVRLIISEARAGYSRIHCAHILPEGLSALLAKLSNKNLKVISYVHGEDIIAYQSSRELYLLAKLIIKYTDLIVCNSRNSKKLLQDTFSNIPDSKIIISYPCIKYDQFITKENKNILRQKYSISEDAIVLISVARLIPRKNQISTIRAITELSDTFPNIIYISVGNGPELERLQSESTLLGSSDRVRFLTAENDHGKAELLNLSDIFVMPTIPTKSDIEGFGIALLEAQASGLPVICGNSGGEKEAVMENQTALITDGSVTDIKNKILYLTNNPELRLKMAKLGKQYAKEFNSKSSAIKLYTEISDAI